MATPTATCPGATAETWSALASGRGDSTPDPAPAQLAMVTYQARTASGRLEVGRRPSLEWTNAGMRPGAGPTVVLPSPPPAPASNRGGQDGQQRQQTSPRTRPLSRWSQCLRTIP
jgi:hypothetical protein